jgi:hypothetical protein
MNVSLIIVKYPWWAVPFAFLSMALFRVPLWLHKKISFWRLMGSGRNGSFDLRPDLRQWAIFIVEKAAAAAPGEPGTTAITSHKTPPTPSRFINNWIKFFNGTTSIYRLQPIEGYGLWEGKEVFGSLPKQTDYEGEIAVLTRATIRIRKLYRFWKNVPAVADKTNNAKGLVISYGIGEIPLIKQATFSVWESRQAMKAFAYNLQEHKDVVRKTHTEKWYREEMFVRFRIVNRES